MAEAAQATTVDEAMAEVRERTGPLPEPSDEQKALCVEGECGGCIICYGPGVPVFGPRTVIALADEIDRLRAALADGVAAGPSLGVDPETEEAYRQRVSEAWASGDPCPQPDGVAAEPQATPGQVLWEGPAYDLLIDRRGLGGHQSLSIAAVANIAHTARVRVVAAPTGQEGAGR